MADQRLNIIFSGDASQLDAAIKQVTAEIEALEKQLLDLQKQNITAGVDVSQFKILSTQLDAAKAKLIDLSKQKVSITGDAGDVTRLIELLKVKLDSLESQKITITGAGLAELESQITSLKTEIGSLESRKISIDADTSKALAEIKFLESQVESLESLKIAPDITPAQLDVFNRTIDNLKGKLNALKTGIKVPITGDGTDISRLIDLLKARLESLESQKVTVTGEGLDKLNAQILQTKTAIESLSGKQVVIDIKTQEALQEIKVLEDQIAGLERLKVAPEVTPVQIELFNRNIEQIKTRLNELKAGVKIPITGDAKQVQGLISAIETSLNSLSAKITLDPSEFRRQVENLRSQVEQIDANIEIHGDRSQFDIAINEIKAKLQALTDPELDITANSAQAIGAIKEVTDLVSKIKSSELVLRADNSDVLKSVSAVETALQSLEATVVFDQTSVRAEAEKIKIALESLSAQVTINGDPTGAETAIKSIREKLALLTDETVDITADPTKALTVIEGIKTELSALRGTITINTAGVDTSINNIKTAIATIDEQVSIRVNTAQAEANIAEIKGRIQSIRGSDIVLQANGKQVVATINLIESELIQLEKQLKQTTDPKQIQNLNRTLLTVRDSIKGIQTTNLQTQFKGISAASNQATFALTNIGRVAQDLPFGFIGIANNITPLIESFQRLSVEARQTGTSVGKQLLGALKGGGGVILAFSALSAVMSFATLGLQFFGRGMKSAKKDTEDAKDAIKGFADSAAGEAAKLTVLVGIAKNVNATSEDRKKALAALNSEYGKYLDNIDKEKISLKTIDDAYNKLIDTLVNKAIVQGLQKKITSEVEKVAERIIEINLPVAELQKQFDASADAAKGLTEQSKVVVKTQKDSLPVYEKVRLGVQNMNDAIRDGALAAQEFQKAQGRQLAQENSFLKVRERVTALTKKLIDDLKEGLKPLLSLTTDFELISDATPKDFKDKTEDIIARARQFKKEFGEAFVLPDLDDEFFKTREELLNASKDLLDRVQRFIRGDQKALQIKLPVLFELETVQNKEDLQKFLRDEIEFFDIRSERIIRIPMQIAPELLPPDIAQAERNIDDLVARFFNSVAEEQRDIDIPIGVGVDVSLKKPNLDAINKKLDLRKQFEQFGDLGLKTFLKIDFTDINEGLSEATRKLTSMIDIANTLSQAIGQGLANAFNSVFDAILKGENVFKALGEAVKQLVIDTIKAVIQMLILRAVTNALFSGGGGPGGIVGGIIGGFTGGQIAAPTIRASGGSRANVGGQLSVAVRGTDLVFVLQQGQNTIGRSGG